MATTENRQISFLADILRLRDFAKKIGFNPGVFLICAAFAMIVAVFESLIVALLVPLAQGTITMDFGFVLEYSALKSLLAVLRPGIAVSNSTIFISLVVLIFLTSIIKNLFQYASMLSVAYQIRDFCNKTRKLVFNRCLLFGKLYFDRTNAGYMHGLLVNFINTVAARLTELQQLFTYVFMLVAYLVMMLVISWKLTLFVFVVFPSLHYALKRLIGRIKTMSKLYSDAQADLSRRIYNILSCILIVKSYAQEKGEEERFARASDGVRDSEFNIDKWCMLVVPLQEIIVLLLVLLLVAAMAFMVSIQGKAMIPGFLIYFYIIRRATNAFGVINTMKASFATMSGPLDEIRTVLDDEDKYFIPQGRREFEGVEHNIEFRNLSHSYVAEAPVLKNISFTIGKGEMTAIVGPSGSGKTTIINLLARFYDSAPATILVDGIDIRDFSLSSLRSKIALVNQETMLFNDTIKANLIYGLDGQTPREKILEAARKARLDGLIKQLPGGLETNIGDRGVQLSGGEKQRLAIARAILKGAEILILDEATSSLDTSTEKLIQEAIDEMIDNKTAIVIAHRLSTIKKADKIVVIEDGRVVETGSLDDLLRDRGKFYRYWEEQKFF